jgi:hypothetical protein
MTAENVAASPPTKPTVPVDRVVERIVNQTLDAAFESGEKLHVASLIKAAGDAIVQHPAQGTIILWLAEEKLEGMFDSLASEHGIDLDYISGLLKVKATEEDLNYVPPDD